MAPERTPENDRERAPTTVGGARNEHGTRISRRIQCMRCGKVDHVSFAPKDRGKSMCRACAEEVLKAFEVGVRRRHQTQTLACVVCSVSFELPENIEDDGEMVCKNCLRNFMSWQGTLDTPLDLRGKSELRRSGARIRHREKKNPEAPGEQS